MNKFQKHLAGAVITAGAALGASEAFANTTCGCSSTGNYYGKIDESNTWQEAFDDAPGAAKRKGVKAGTECHIRGHGSFDGTNYVATFNGQGFSEWKKFKGGNKCNGSSRKVTESEKPVKETKGKATGGFTETSKGNTKLVIDLGKAPAVCKPYIDAMKLAR